MVGDNALEAVLDSIAAKAALIRNTAAENPMIRRDARVMGQIAGQIVDDVRLFRDIKQSTRGTHHDTAQ